MVHAKWIFIKWMNGHHSFSHFSLASSVSSSLLDHLRHQTCSSIKIHLLYLHIYISLLPYFCFLLQKNSRVLSCLNFLNSHPLQSKLCLHNSAETSCQHHKQPSKLQNPMVVFLYSSYWPFVSKPWHSALPLRDTYPPPPTQNLLLSWMKWHQTLWLSLPFYQLLLRLLFRLLSSTRSSNTSFPGLSLFCLLFSPYMPSIIVVAFQYYR